MLNNTSGPLRSKSAAKLKSARGKDQEPKLANLEGVPAPPYDKKIPRLQQLILYSKDKKDETTPMTKRTKSKMHKQNKTTEKGRTGSRPSSVEKKQHAEKSAEKPRGSSKKKVQRAPKTSRPENPHNISTKNTTLVSSTSYIDAIKSSKQNTQAGEWDQQPGHGQEYGIKSSYIRLKQATNRLRMRRRGMTEHTQDSSSEVSNSMNSKATISSRLAKNLTLHKEQAYHSKSSMITKNSKIKDKKQSTLTDERTSHEKPMSQYTAGSLLGARGQQEADITSDNLQELFSHAKKALKQRADRQSSTEKKGFVHKGSVGAGNTVAGGAIGGNIGRDGGLGLNPPGNGSRHLNSLGNNVFAAGQSMTVSQDSTTRVQPETGSFGSSKAARLVNNLPSGAMQASLNANESREAASQRKASAEAEPEGIVRMAHKFVAVRSESPPELVRRFQPTKGKKKVRRVEENKEERAKREPLGITRASMLAMSTSSVSKLLTGIVSKSTKDNGMFGSKKTIAAPVPKKAKLVKKKGLFGSSEKQVAVNKLLRQSADNFKKSPGDKEYFSKTGFERPVSKEPEVVPNKQLPSALIQNSKLFSALRTSQTKETPVVEPTFQEKGYLARPNQQETRKLRIREESSSPSVENSQDTPTNRILLSSAIRQQFKATKNHANPLQKDYQNAPLPQTISGAGPLPFTSSQHIESRFREFVRQNEQQWREFLREVEGYRQPKEVDLSKASHGTSSSLVRRIEKVQRKAQRCLRIVNAAVNNEESSLGVVSGEITSGMIHDSHNYGYGSSRANLLTEKNEVDPYRFEEDLIVEQASRSNNKIKDGSAAAKLQNFLPPVKENDNASNPQSAAQKTPRDQDTMGSSYLRFNKQVPYTPFELNADSKYSQKSKKSQASSAKEDKAIRSFDQKPELVAGTGSIPQHTNLACDPKQGSANQLETVPKAAKIDSKTHLANMHRGEQNHEPLFCSSSGQLRSLRDSDRPHSNYEDESLSGSLIGMERMAALPHQGAGERMPSTNFDGRNEKSPSQQSVKSGLRIGVDQEEGEPNQAEDSDYQPTVVVSPLHQKGPSLSGKPMSRFHQHLVLEVWTNKNNDNDKLLRPCRSSGGASSSRLSNKSLSEIQHNSLLHSKIDTVFGKSKTEQQVAPQSLANGFLPQPSPTQLSLRPASDSQSQTVQEHKSLPNDMQSVLSGRSPHSESGSRIEQNHTSADRETNHNNGKHHQVFETLHQQLLGPSIIVDSIGGPDAPRNQLIEIHNWYEGSLVESPPAGQIGSPSLPGMRNIFKQMNSPPNPLNDPEVFMSESSDQRPTISLSSGVKPLFGSKLTTHFAINEAISSQQNDSQASARESVQPGQETPSLLQSPTANTGDHQQKRILVLDSEEKAVHLHIGGDQETQNCAVVLELDPILDPRDPAQGQNASGAEESIVFSSVGEKADIITSFILENLLVEAVAEDHCINKFIDILGPTLLHLESSRFENYLSRLMDRVLGDEIETVTVLKRLNTPIGPSDIQRLMMSSPNLSEADQESLSSFLYEPVLDVKLYVSVEESLRETEYKVRELDQVQMERQHIVHKMIFDALNEVLDYKRLYGISGKPMPFETGFKTQTPYKAADLRRIFNSAFSKLRSWEKIKAGRLLEKDPKTKHNEPEELEKIREKALEEIVTEYVGLMLLQTLILDEKWSFTTEEYLESFLLVTECVLEQLVEDSVGEFERIQAARSGIILSKGVPRSQTIGWNRGDAPTRKLSKRGLGKQSVLFGANGSTEQLHLSPEI